VSWEWLREMGGRAGWEVIADERAEPESELTPSERSTDLAIESQPASSSGRTSDDEWEDLADRSSSPVCSSMSGGGVGVEGGVKKSALTADVGDGARLEIVRGWRRNVESCPDDIVHNSSNSERR
jgi:hypothetical protein